MSALLQAHRVAKVYPPDIHALRDVSLSVRQGETVALIGESGCGKTTLLRLFNRMVDPTSGTVSVGGKPTHQLDPVTLRRHTGYVQQEGGLLPHWTVARNVALVPRLLGWDDARIQTRVGELLEMVGMEPRIFAGRYPVELSGGQRQRVAFARSLASDPEVVLLDEPFGALDALTRLEIQVEFRRLQKVVNKTMLLVTHDLDEAFRLADTVAVMQHGRILQLGTPAEVESAPQDGFVADLIRTRQEVRS